MIKTNQPPISDYSPKQGKINDLKMRISVLERTIESYDVAEKNRVMQMFVDEMKNGLKYIQEER
jgi:hypothetical protein